MGYRKLTALLLAGSAFSALFAGTAAAQEGAAPTVDEVIVTARKVSENIQEVPMVLRADSTRGASPKRSASAIAFSPHSIAWR